MGGARGNAPPALELTAAGRRYGSLTALHPVTLSVDSGTTCLVHGANGSGKTTLLRLCAGVLTPTNGDRRAAGRSLYLRSGSGARRRQTVWEALRSAAELAGRSRGRVGDALDAADLAALASRRVETLSSGQRSRLLIALALVTSPTLACLDEPTVHLDEEGVATVRAGVRRLAASGTAVLVATHDRDLLGDDPDARLVVEVGRVGVAP